MPMREHQGVQDFLRAALRLFARQASTRRAAMARMASMLSLPTSWRTERTQASSLFSWRRRFRLRSSSTACATPRQLREVGLVLRQPLVGLAQPRRGWS